MHAMTAPDTEAMRIIVADGTPMNSQLLAETLSRDKRFEVCGAFCDSGSVLAAVDREEPHVTLLSAHLEDGDSKGFEVAQALRARQAETRTIMLLDSSEQHAVVEAFRSGARGIFCRTQSLKSLAKCILCVHSGQIWANSSELGFLLQAFSEGRTLGQPELRTSAKLSRREQDVVRCVAEGLTNREIAKHLGLTEHTIKNYLFRIFDKLGVSTRVELVLHSLAVPRPPATAAVSSVIRTPISIEMQKVQTPGPKPVVAMVGEDSRGRLPSRQR